MNSLRWNLGFHLRVRKLTFWALLFLPRAMLGHPPDHELVIHRAAASCLYLWGRGSLGNSLWKNSTGETLETQSPSLRVTQSLWSWAARMGSFGVPVAAGIPIGRTGWRGFWMVLGTPFLSPLCVLIILALGFMLFFSFVSLERVSVLQNEITV